MTLSITTLCQYAECHYSRVLDLISCYAECQHAECDFAECSYAEGCCALMLAFRATALESLRE
jgi:hypothetical protein